MNALVDLLQAISTRPGMFCMRDQWHSIHFIHWFMMGYDHGQRHAEDPDLFDSFGFWLAAHYRVRQSHPIGLILDRTGGDEAAAFDEFFRLLPLYLRDKTELGAAGINERFVTVMREIEARQ